MSHDDHKPGGPITLIEKIDGPDFGLRTVNELLSSAILARCTGMGNALEANFIAETTSGQFTVHFHLCVTPVGEQQSGAGHVKH